MTSVYVLEHVVRYEGSQILDVYDTWDALLYGVSQHYPVPTDEPTAALLTVDDTSEHEPTQWSTPGYGLSEEEWLRVTKRTIRTETKALYEVRVRSTILGNIHDRVIRDSDTISDERHANALAAGWNTEPPFGMEDDAEFYVKRLN